jgi:molybdate transport system substrate-binding protein
MTRRRTRLLAALSAALLLAGCSTQPPALSEPAASDGRLSGELTVFAAASLIGSFDDLGGAFARDNTGLAVRDIVYDGSSTLVTQITEGASADVFASADAATMKRAMDRGLIAGQPSTFASNTLQIAVAPGNPKHITGLADLAAKDLLVVLCAPKVPCGAASHEILRLDGVTVAPVSEEQNVKAVLTKVSAGEADAGLVYRTDVAASNGSVDGVDIAGADRVVNKYSIGVPKDARNAAAGAAFVKWVLSDRGQKILEGFGFGKP